MPVAYVSRSGLRLQDFLSEARASHLTAKNRFEDLILPHLDAAHDLADELMRNPHDAEDVVQDACLRALKYIGALQGKDGKPWFLMIVRRASYDWYQRNHPTELVGDRDICIDLSIDYAPIDPEQAALRSAASRALADAVAELPFAFREVLILRELNELSYKQIARIADIPIGTVMSRLARARGLLQRSSLLFDQ
jgi:RNA polymerase sigma-70 factor (ECF subfamily)